MPSWLEVYGHEAPLAVDIGFGAGRFLLALAQQRPTWNVLGLEIRQHWVDDVQQAARAAGITNLHAMVANASIHLADLIPERSVVFTSLNFPDPWYKKRHHKRRVLTAEWLDLLARKMIPGAELHYMTDYEAAAIEALAILERHPDFSSPSSGFQTASTTGIPTEREHAHSARNEPIYRLRYVRGPDLHPI